MIKKAVFWDFDGTLIHANESSFCALKEALQQNRYSVDEGEIRAALCTSLSWYNWETTYESGTGEKWWNRLFSNLGSFYARHGISDSDKVNAAFRENVLTFRYYTLFEDARNVLETCKRLGYRNYIVSNNYPELPNAIEKLGIDKFFSGYVISSQIGFEKPRPEIFQYAMELAGNPETCYMVGDNLFADIQGASALGIQTIFVHPPAKGQLKCANYTCDSLSDILDIIV